MGKAYRLMMEEVTLEKALEIRHTKGIRLTTSPFGVDIDQYETNPPRYVSRSVKWKGATDFIRTKLEAAIPKIAAIKPQVAGALQMAVKISQAYKGVKDTVIIDRKKYPKKAIEQKKWREKPDLVSEYNRLKAEAGWVKPKY